MKKILLASLLLLGLGAQAQEVRLYGDGNVTDQVAGQVFFNLELASSYIYKLKNEKMAASIPSASWTAADATERGIDLGKITAGISTATSCADLTGLTQVADLEVVAATDTETGIADDATSALCDINNPSAGVKVVRLSIPLAESLQIAGNGSMDVAYGTTSTVGEEFNTIQIEDGAASAAVLANAPVAAAAKTALTSGHKSQLRMRLEARIAGAGTKTNYSGYMTVALTPTLN